MSVIQEALEKAGRFSGKSVWKKSLLGFPTMRMRLLNRNVRRSHKPMPKVYIAVLLALLFLGGTIGIYSAGMRPHQYYQFDKMPPLFLASFQIPMPSMIEGIMKTPELHLAGITFSEDTQFAVINDRVLSVGDSVDNAVITEIQQDAVLLNYYGRDVRLQI